MRDTLLTFSVALRTIVFSLVLTGVLYPLAMTGLAQLLFPTQAHGSLVTDDKGHVVGSSLIGQRFRGAAYFQPRPSAAGDAGYDAVASSGSNLGPTASKLRERALADIARLRQDNPEARGPIPAELLTTSASGLDPHLSPAAAMWQVARVARARGIAPQRVTAVIQDQLQGRALGFLGEPTVNVLLLNLALDEQFGRPGPAS